MSVIRTENLGKTYGRRTVALEGLDLEVETGEVFGFLGPNGAGKSTTIQLLLHFIRPTSGQAFLFDRPVHEARVRSRLGYLPESVNLHTYYTGQALLEFYSGLLGLPSEEAPRRVAALLDRVGLGDAAQQKVATYSKGMQQRLGLAQALLGEPELLILDEPTSNLDAVARRDVRDVLLQLKSRGATIFICSHILSEVESVCDRVAILQEGRLRRLGTMAELSATRTSRLVARNLPAAAIEAVSAAGARLTLNQGEATIECGDDTVRTAVEAALGRLGVQVERVETGTQSLEEIFFGAIGPQEPTA